MRVLLLVWTCSVIPAWAAAQSAPATRPANDAVLSIGWSGSEHHSHEQRRWHGSPLVALRVGHYWSDQLKTEVEGSWNSVQRNGLYEPIERQGGVTYALYDYRATDIRTGASQIYQFGRNEWVHPYFGAGIDIVRRDTSLARLPQTRAVYFQNRNVPVEIPASNERATHVTANAVMRTGLKMYVEEKAFVDTELKLGLSRDVEHVVWTIGFGLDF